MKKRMIDKVYRQFQLLVYACRGWWEVRYHIANYAGKISIKTTETTEIFQYLQKYKLSLRIYTDTIFIFSA
jgi:hypothetical protein